MQWCRTPKLTGFGLGRGAIQHRLERRRLHPIHQGVYGVGRRRLTRSGAWTAAVLACGSGAVLSHRSAAVLWGPRRGDPVRTEVTVPAGSAGARASAPIARFLSRRDHGSRRHTEHHGGSHPPRPGRHRRPTRGAASHGAGRSAPACRPRTPDCSRRSLPRTPGDRGGGGDPPRPRGTPRGRHHPQRARGPLPASSPTGSFRRSAPTFGCSSEKDWVEGDCVWADHGVVVELDSWCHHSSKGAPRRESTRDRRLRLAAGSRFGSRAGISTKTRSALETDLLALTSARRATP